MTTDNTPGSIDIDMSGTIILNSLVFRDIANVSFYDFLLITNYYFLMK